MKLLEAILRRFKLWFNTHTQHTKKDDTKYIENLFSNELNDFLLAPTNIKTLDTLLGGGYLSGIHVIGAPTGCGKSSLCIHLSKNFIDQGLKVQFNTYEISKRQVWARHASTISDKSWSDIEFNPQSLTTEEKTLVKKMAVNLKVESGLNIAQIIESSKNFDVIFIDYIQRMPGDTDNKLSSISNNIEALSNIARDTGKIIILVSSINRFGYDEPTLQSLKYCGDIEFMVASAMFLKLPDLTNTMSGVIAKNTRGMCGDFILSSDLAHCRFVGG